MMQKDKKVDILSLIHNSNVQLEFITRMGLKI